MKSTAVDESLSSMNQQFCSRENQLLQMLQQNEKSTQKKCIKHPVDKVHLRDTLHQLKDEETDNDTEGITYDMYTNCARKFNLQL